MENDSHNLKEAIRKSIFDDPVDLFNLNQINNAPATNAMQQHSSPSLPYSQRLHASRSVPGSRRNSGDDHTLNLLLGSKLSLNDRDSSFSNRKFGGFATFQQQEPIGTMKSSQRKSMDSLSVRESDLSLFNPLRQPDESPILGFPAKRQSSGLNDEYPDLFTMTNLENKSPILSSSSTIHSNHNSDTESVISNGSVTPTIKKKPWIPTMMMMTPIHSATSATTPSNPNSSNIQAASKNGNGIVNNQVKEESSPFTKSNNTAAATNSYTASQEAASDRYSYGWQQSSTSSSSVRAQQQPQNNQQTMKETTRLVNSKSFSDLVSLNLLYGSSRNDIGQLNPLKIAKPQPPVQSEIFQPQSPPSQAYTQTTQPDSTSRVPLQATQAMHSAQAQQLSQPSQLPVSSTSQAQQPRDIVLCPQFQQFGYCLGGNMCSYAHFINPPPAVIAQQRHQPQQPQPQSPYHHALQPPPPPSAPLPVLPTSTVNGSLYQHYTMYQPSILPTPPPIPPTNYASPSPQQAKLAQQPQHHYHIQHQHHQQRNTKGHRSQHYNKSSYNNYSHQRNRNNQQHQNHHHHSNQQHQHQDKYANATLEEFIGKLYSLCKDQNGCRFLQKKIDEDEQKNILPIFKEILPHFVELMTDPFGNYLCQKMLEKCPSAQRTEIIEIVAPELVNIALNMHGTRAVQKLIDYLATPEQIQLVTMSLQPHVVTLIKDLNGNHVIQKCLFKLPAEYNQFIYDIVCENCIEVASHKHGCCVLQRCFDHATENQKDQLVNEIARHALPLVQNPFGNYVVQYVLELGVTEYSESVIRRFVNHVCLLSVQKFSSNVIENCIRTAQPETRRLLVAELMDEKVLEKLLHDSFGNYVVQTSLDFADEDQRAQLVECIRPLLPTIRTTPYGKRIHSKIVRDTASTTTTTATSSVSSGSVPVTPAMTAAEPSVENNHSD